MKYPCDYVPMIEDGFEVCYFVDIETTGLETFRSEILTASFSVVDYHSQVELDSIELRFRPERKTFWDEESATIHGISYEDAMAFPRKKDSTEQMYDFLLKHSRSHMQPMVCHALKFAGFFDTAHLEAHFLEYDMLYDYRIICGIHQSTINYAKAYAANKKSGFDDYKLSTLAQHFKIPLNHHNASSDRKACQRLYKIFKQAEDSMELDTTPDKKTKKKVTVTQNESLL